MRFDRFVTSDKILLNHYCSDICVTLPLSRICKGTGNSGYLCPAVCLGVRFFLNVRVFIFPVFRFLPDFEQAYRIDQTL